MKMNRPISRILTLRLVAMATSLERSEKEGLKNNPPPNTYHMVKCGENWSSISRDYGMRS